MVEKSRNMVVSVMIDLHGINGTLLDVGCGMLLTLVAFLYNHATVLTYFYCVCYSRRRCAG